MLKKSLGMQPTDLKNSMDMREDDHLYISNKGMGTGYII
jgi:hypothetical protein